ncbi:hypothetical protein CPJCM30710_33810 [Clostridium polyendosporum]|uniref:VCBS repeat-containing protein n=1 Tax=Clostridium polyendosporum TaxID=69208 RepID=A0A919S3S7_9CLOT|nr:VCBS repeat-containing protein [Clostridium polyendosporum]GIM30715.1 hypothetical protein CPJCM30710_33810 [Clostridium polyendosporum]
MKVRIIMVSKQAMVLIMLLVIGIILTSIFFSFTKTPQDLSSLPTSSSVGNDKVLKKDLNGDGQEDILYITTKNNKYYMQVNSNNKSFFLEPNKKLNTVGTYSNFWPMGITLLDLSRDRIPEILVQASQDNVPIQHIFKWETDSFKDIFSSTNNVFGVIDSKNNKTPKLVSMTIKNGALNVQQYMIIGDELKNCTYENYPILGLENVMLFIDLIESTGEIEKLYDIFKSSLSQDELSILWKLGKTDYMFEFQDAFFQDTKWDKNGKTEEIQWILNFKKALIHEKDSPSQIKIQITLGAEGDMFKIGVIKLEKAK